MSTTATPPPPSPLDERFGALLARVPDADGGRDLVQRAFDVAQRFHHNQVRRSGALYIEHPLAVATLLADLNMDAPSIAAGLLHDVLEDTELSIEELKALFPEPVPALVQGVTKIGRIHFDTSRDHQIENLRKIILAMARDIRVIIIKLCDRLHNMRTLKFLPADKRQGISRESLDIYAPLANRLGMVVLKTELEDLAMYWLYPDEYQKLTRSMSKKKRERESAIERSVDYLREFLEEQGQQGIEVTGRPKHFYSIFRKMEKTGQSFDEIYDLNAVRVLCRSEAQCYEIMGLIHSIWTPLPGRIKDYIGMPKPNMYQSLHTTVIGLDGMVTEIQIRTHEMHRIAEFGIAAHWKYKEGRLDQDVDRRLDWLRRLSEWIAEVNDSSSFLDALKKDVFADVVLCFTPKGDVIELPAGATPIDFAYAIHSKVGERCVGAYVNRRMATLRTPLKHGDVVEILTSSSGHPSRDWLDIATTGRARTKIKHWLKSKEMVKWVSDGRAALLRILKERNIEVTKAELDRHLELLREPLRMQTIEDVLAEIGFGSISPQAAVTRMNPEWARARRMPRRKPARASARPEDMIVVQGLEGLTVHLSHCCKPIMGDAIVAYISRGRGVRIHRSDCMHIQRVRANHEEIERLVPANWDGEQDTVSTIYIKVEAHDRAGLLMELSQVFTRHNLFIVACNTRSDKKRGIAAMRMQAEVRDLGQVDVVLESLRRVDGVIRAERTTRMTA